MSRWTKRNALALGALAVAAAMAGCTDSPLESGSGSTHAGSTHAAPGRTMHFQLADAPAGPVNAQVPSQPIASTPTSVPGVTLQVYSVTRQRPGAALIVFALQLTSQAANPNNSLNALGQLDGKDEISGSVNAVSLFDPAGLKQYETFMSNPDNDSTCLCSAYNTDELTSGVSYFAALVAAPPPRVKTVSFVTPVGTIPGVPVS